MADGSVHAFKKPIPRYPPPPAQPDPLTLWYIYASGWNDAKSVPMDELSD
jgi:hypothetical protein